MASVRRLKKDDPKSPWVVEYTDRCGKRRRATPKSGLKKDADWLRQKIEREIEDGAHTPRSETVTVRDAGQIFYEETMRRRRQGDKMAGATAYSYHGALKNHIVKDLGGVLLTKLTSEMMQDYVNQKRDQYEYRSVATYFGVLKLLLKFAVRKKWIAVDPLIAQPVRVPGEARKKAVPSKDDIRAFLEAVKVRRKNEFQKTYEMRVSILLLGLFCGLRRGEIAGLQWENIDFERGYIHVRHSLSYHDGLKGPKSKAGVRSIPMIGPVRDLFARLAAKAGPKPSGYVLTSNSGAPVQPADFSDLWRPVIEQAGLMKPDGKPMYTPHSLRHACASMLAQQGIPPLNLKTIIGHEHVSTTLSVYGHLFPDDGASEKALSNASGEFLVQLEMRERPRPSRATGMRQLRSMTAQLPDSIG